MEETRRLHAQAFEILRARIEAGALPPGTCLTESEVAAEFGTSRAPARRALADLARRGTLVRLTGRGYAVPGQPAATADRAAAGWAGGQLKAAPAWRRIYAEVEEEIIGRIAFARWQLKEARLAEHYRVSRTVARDVVGRLQQSGLIAKDQRSRWYAPELTPEHVGELYELRAILEPIALTKAAPNLPDGLPVRMRENLVRVAACRNVEGWVLDRLEHEMHVQMLSHCGNRSLMHALVLPQSLLTAHRFLYRLTPRLFETEPFLPEHLRIIDHLIERAPSAAADALAQHLHVSSRRALARISAIRKAVRVRELPYLVVLAT